MIELKTPEAVAEFARDAMGRSGTRIVEAHKPADTFAIARRLDADTTGETWSREGKLEQSWSASAGDWLVTMCDKNGEPLLAADTPDAFEHLAHIDEMIRRVQAEIDGMESGTFAYTRDGMDEMSHMLAEQIIARDSVMSHVHTNSYPMSAATFEEKYGSENVDERGVVAAQSIPQTFIVLDESVGVGDDGIYIHQSWGDGEVLSKGAMLNVTGIDKGDIYGVDPVFFAEAYEIDSEWSPDSQHETADRGADSARGDVSLRTPIGGWAALDEDDSFAGFDGGLSL